MNELNKKLAEWADIKPFLSETYSKKELRQFLYDHTPYFTESLDACNKWLIPKLQWYQLNNWNKKKEHIAFVSVEEGKTFSGKDNHNPALALCLAIEKLIDKEVLNEEDGTSRTNNLPNEKE